MMWLYHKDLLAKRQRKDGRRLKIYTLKCYTAAEKNGQLEVTIYPTNKNIYTLIGFNKRFGLGYFGKDLYLQTDKGDKGYTTPTTPTTPRSFGGARGVNGTFYFDVSDGSTNRVLKISYLIMQSNETENINLPVPKLGEAKEVNKVIKFKDGSAIITSVEKISGYNGGELKINLQYQNIYDNKKMISIGFGRINLQGATQSSGCYSHADENEVIDTIYFILEEGENDNIRLQANNAQYLFIDEYSLTLDSK